MAWIYADDIALNYNLGIAERDDEEISSHKVTALPNPCTQGTNFNFQLPTGLEYRITLFDVLGRRVRTLNGVASGNLESIKWDRRDDKGGVVDAGVYFYRFESRIMKTSGKVVVK